MEACVGLLGDGSLFTGHLPQRWLWHFTYDVSTLTPTHPVGAFIYFGHLHFIGEEIRPFSL